MFQFGQLVPELTAEENVALPLLLGGIRRAPALAEARTWFGRLGLDGLERRRSGELSGGQAQRVALARGLVAGPEVLFADEPTGSLDSLTGEQVMNLLIAAAREQGTTVVLVTHEARVAAYADREVIVRDGKVSSLARPCDTVISLGLRLTLSGGREAVIRLVILAAAVGAGRRPAADRRLPASTRSTPRTAGTRGCGTGCIARARRTRASAARTRCGGSISADSFSRPAHRSGSTWPPPAPPRRCRRASPAARRRASTTPPRRWPGCCAPPRPASSPTAIPAAGRHDRPGAAPARTRTALIIIVGHTAAQLARTPGASAVSEHRDHPAGQLQRACTCAVRRRHQSQRHRPHPGSGGAGPADPGADLHRHRDPAVSCPPRAAVRRDAAGRRARRGRSR